jgi:ketosteroid isomerase-like protein
MLTDTDRLDILEVVARADAAATHRDADTYAALFTDDVVLDGEKGEYRGNERLRQSVGPIWESEGLSSVHLTLNSIVNQIDGHPDSAIATSILLILRNASPLTIHSVSAITQHLVRRQSGWLIERRSVARVTGAND